MSNVQQTDENVHAHHASPLVEWGLLTGGALFFIGGSMHPGEDPPGLSTLEHLRLMFLDPSWYPSHALLLVGMVLIAASLFGLVRSRSLAAVPRAQMVGAVAAIAAALATLAMLLHMAAASEADKIAAGQGAPLTNVQNVTETLTAPAFGFSIAALALVGASTRTLGNWVIAALGLVGGLSYGLAGGTAFFTDRLNFLFPASSGIGLWAIAAGIALFLRSRAADRGARAA